MFIIFVAATRLCAESDEPVYLEYIRKSKPILHYRLKDLVSLTNLFQTGEGPANAGAAQGASNRVEIARGPSPRDLVGVDPLNGFEENNACLQFLHTDDGPNGVVVIPGAAIPDLAEPHADEFSLSVWVKAAARQVNRAGIVTRKARDDLDKYQFALAMWDNHYDIIMTEPDGTFRSFFTDTGPDESWQHLVLVLDSKDRYQNYAGSVRFYINGKKVFTGATKNHSRTTMHMSQADVVIGGMAYNQSESGGFNRAFNGRIDEVTLWNRALSDQEVEELFKAAVIGRKPMVIIIGRASSICSPRNDG